MLRSDQDFICMMVLMQNLVTGGAGTLALAAARALLEHGLANLTLFDLRSTFDSSDEVIEALHTDFPSAKIICSAVDVTDAEAVTRAFDAAAARHSIDILLCFAGVVGCLHAVEMTPEQWVVPSTSTPLAHSSALKQPQHTCANKTPAAASSLPPPSAATASISRNLKSLITSVKLLLLP